MGGDPVRVSLDAALLAGCLAAGFPMRAGGAGPIGPIALDRAKAAATGTIESEGGRRGSQQRSPSNAQGNRYYDHAHYYELHSYATL